MKSLLLLMILCCTSALYAVQEQAITFQSEPFTLYGTLSLPDGAGPFPAVVLVHGSGPQDRDQTFPVTDEKTACLYPGTLGKTIRTFRDIARAFTAHGIAVLRYDKQTYTYGQQLDPQTISPYDLVVDIHSAVDFLASRPEIDPSAIMLLGHSEGGNFLPLVARERTDIAALIGLAAPARPIDDMLVEQVRYIERVCGDSALGEAQAQQIRQIFDMVRAGTWDANTPILGVYPSYWRDWMALGDSAVADYNSVSQPTLFLQGTADYNVTTTDAALFAEGVTREPVDVVLLPGLNHQFITEGTAEVAPVVVDTIVAWLQQRGLVATSVQEEREVPGQLVVVYDHDVPVLRCQPAPAAQTVRITDVFGRLAAEYTVGAGSSADLRFEGAAPGLYGYTVSGGTPVRGVLVVRK